MIAWEAWGSSLYIVLIIEYILYNVINQLFTGGSNRPSFFMLHPTQTKSEARIQLVCAAHQSGHTWGLARWYYNLP